MDTPFCDYFANWKPWQRKRFLSKIGRRVGDRCWQWLGNINPEGYGRVFIPTLNRPVSAHRAVFAYYSGQEPGASLICHHCDNPSCVNPAHLYAGTPQSNMDDKINRERGNWQKGSRVTCAKLTEKTVIEARTRYARNERLVDLAAEFNVSRGTLGKAIHGETWKHVQAGLDLVDFRAKT